MYIDTQYIHAHLQCLHYLHQASLVHGTEYEEGVGGPLHVDYQVQAGVEVQDLQAVYISNHQPVLNTRSLQTGRTQTINELIN